MHMRQSTFRWRFSLCIRGEFARTSCGRRVGKSATCRRTSRLEWSPTRSSREGTSAHISGISAATSTNWCVCCCRQIGLQKAFSRRYCVSTPRGAIKGWLPENFPFVVQARNACFSDTQMRGLFVSISTRSRSIAPRCASTLRASRHR